jgi:hypothetical protein
MELESFITLSGIPDIFVNGKTVELAAPVAS